MTATRKKSSRPAAAKPARRAPRPRCPPPRHPLLIVDGDSFAHRAYHALPKTILRHGGKSGGAIVGFANFLLRLYENERPRAVLVGWDTLAAPTWIVAPASRLSNA